MARSDEPASRLLFFTSEFKRNMRQLARKYRRIKQDVQPLLDDLGARKTPGDRIPGVPDEVYKARARNSDSQRGKSGGYRLIYEVTPEDTIILLTIYSKTEQEDISVQDIAAIIIAYAHEDGEAEPQRSARNEERPQDEGEEQQA
jgi:mRNA-degrading endonuclease RelE of RelBE toxin-antitoxin system